MTSPDMSGVADYEPDDPQAEAVEDSSGEDELAPGRGVLDDDEDIAEPNEPA